MASRQSSPPPNIRMSPGLQNAIAIISPVAAIAAAVIALMRVLGRLDRRLDHIEISIHGRKPKSCTPNRFPIRYLKPNARKHHDGRSDQGTNLMRLLFDAKVWPRLAGDCRLNR